MALTKDQILQAADQLAAAGTAPTLAAVRAAVGGGSYTTINKTLKEWKAKWGGDVVEGWATLLG